MNHKNNEYLGLLTGEQGDTLLFLFTGDMKTWQHYRDRRISFNFPINQAAFAIMCFSWISGLQQKTSIFNDRYHFNLHLELTNGKNQILA